MKALVENLLADRGFLLETVNVARYDKASTADQPDIDGGEDFRIGEVPISEALTGDAIIVAGSL